MSPVHSWGDQRAATCFLVGEVTLLVGVILRVSEQFIGLAPLAGCIGGLIIDTMLGGRTVVATVKTIAVAVLGAVVLVVALVTSGVGVVLVWPLSLAALAWIAAALLRGFARGEPRSRMSLGISLVMLLAGLVSAGWLLALLPETSYESMSPLFIAVPAIVALGVMIESNAFPDAERMEPVQANKRIEQNARR